MNRSVDGDMVVVEIFPKDQWKAPGEEVLDQDCKYFHLSLKQC
jgi:exosome complex exonuclease DIS3/RRP44